MEMEALFLSNLPTDVVHKIYWDLCKSKTISDDLKHEIVWFQKYKDLKELYMEVFFDDPQDDDFYMFWLENNLLLKLNDGIPSNMGVSAKLQKEHPFITTEFLQRNVSTSDIDARTFRLWSLMNIKKKIEFVIDTMLSYR